MKRPRSLGHITERASWHQWVRLMRGPVMHASAAQIYELWRSTRHKNEGYDR